MDHNQNVIMKLYYLIGEKFYGHNFVTGRWWCNCKSFNWKTSSPKGFDRKTENFELLNKFASMQY